MAESEQLILTKTEETSNLTNKIDTLNLELDTNIKKMKVQEDELNELRSNSIRLG